MNRQYIIDESAIISAEKANQMHIEHENQLFQMQLNDCIHKVGTGPNVKCVFSYREDCNAINKLKDVLRLKGYTVVDHRGITSITLDVSF